MKIYYSKVNPSVTSANIMECLRGFKFKSHVERWLDTNGTFLGSGSYAMVYAVNGIAVKVAQDDDRGRQFAQGIVRNRVQRLFTSDEQAFLPNIHAFGHCKGHDDAYGDEDDAGFYISCMEVLTPLAGEDLFQIPNKDHTVLDKCAMFVDNLGSGFLSYHGPEVWGDDLSICELHGTSDQTFRGVIRAFNRQAYGIDSCYKIQMDALRIVDKIYSVIEKISPGADVDVHMGNFMMRGNQLVYTDPVA